MGRCEKERADFNQQADHPFRPAIFGDSRQTLFFAHGHVERANPPRASALATIYSAVIALHYTLSNDVIRSTWSVSRSLRALLPHPLQMAQAHRNLVCQLIRLPQSRPRLR